MIEKTRWRFSSAVYWRGGDPEAEGPGVTGVAALMMGYAARAGDVVGSNNFPHSRICSLSASAASLPPEGA
jgi:hypothetical protein